MRSIASIIFCLIVGYALAGCPSAKLPEPDPSEDGIFSWPNATTQCLLQGSQVNITWSTQYETTNLYFVENDNIGHVFALTLNSPLTWHQWTVDPRSTNRSSTFKLWIVDAQRPIEEQGGSGFFSTHFYIDSGVTATATSEAPSSTRSTESATTAQSTTSLEAASATSYIDIDDYTEEGEDGSDHKALGLGLGLGLGVPFIAAAGVGALFFARKPSKKAAACPRQLTNFEPESKSPGVDKAQVTGSPRMERSARLEVG